jgi:transposase
MITNTYFEGHPQHSQVHLGRSKEKRSDCGLISLGLLLDGSGFVKKSQILPGNISEPGTLKEMLATLSNKSATIIMDAGIATRDNLEYLETEGYKYIAIKRDAELVMPDAEALVVKDTPNNQVTISQQINPDRPNVIDVYCHSTAKEAKIIGFMDKAMQQFEAELDQWAETLPTCHLYRDINEYKRDTSQTTALILANGQVFTNKATGLISLIILIPKFEDEFAANFSHNEALSSLLQNDSVVLSWCNKLLAGSKSNELRLKPKLHSKLCQLLSASALVGRRMNREYSKVMLRLGRLKQRYKHVAYLYEIDIIHDSNKDQALGLRYSKNEERMKHRQSGVYCLTSNRTDLSGEQLWETYTMLTEVEAAFRSLKSELGMRPVYHQLEHRIDGHIFIGVLAYHILHTIRYQLKQHNIHNSWDTLRKMLAMQIRSTTTLDLASGGIVRVRKTSRATPQQALIYKAMGISSLPGKTMKSYFR